MHPYNELVLHSVWHNLPRTVTCTVSSSLASAPACELVPVHLYVPWWSGNTALVMESTDVRLPSSNMSGDTCVIIGSTRAASTGVNGSELETNSHSMVGVRMPVEVHTILTDPPSITSIVAFRILVVGIAARKEEAVLLVSSVSQLITSRRKD